MIHLWRAAVVIAVVAVTIGIVPPASVPPAYAHVDLSLVSPQDGGRLAEAPSELTIFASEPVAEDELDIEVTGQRTGTTVTLGSGHEGEVALTTDYPIQTDMPPDSYLVEVSGVGLDGHAVSEVFEFVLGDGAHIRPNGSIQGGDASAGVQVVSALAKYAGVIAVGISLLPIMLSFVFKRGLVLPELPTLLVLATLIGLGACFTELACQDALARGVGLGEWNTASLRESLDRPFGRLVALRGVALVVLVWLGLRLRARALSARGTEGFEIASLVVIVALLFSFSAAGHAGADEWALVSTCLGSIHLGAVSLWIGGVGFWLLWMSAERRSRSAPVATGQLTPGSAAATSGRRRSSGPTERLPERASDPPGLDSHPLGEVPRTALDNFSTMARWCVGLALGSGTLLAWRTAMVGFGEGIPRAYVAVAAIKVLLVALLLVAALRSHRRWSDRSQDSVSTTELRRTLGQELLLGLSAMFAGALLTVVQ